MDCLDGMKQLDSCSIDIIITDPPYGISFMGKRWDYEVPSVEIWREANRVLKNGGYLLSFSSAKTYHRIAINIEDAGFEIRDQIMWIYGSGFPKSKTNLKPAHEPICVARKKGELFDLNIDDCKVEYKDADDRKSVFKTFGNESSTKNTYGDYAKRSEPFVGDEIGRYPSNVILDEYAAEILDEQSGNLNESIREQGSIRKGNDIFFKGKKALPKFSFNDFGGASRFFYVAKASPSERQENRHPTVKPRKLIHQLIKLYSKEGELILDPFMGSGTTAVCCKETNRQFIGFEREEEYVKIIDKRLSRMLL